MSFCVGYHGAYSAHRWSAIGLMAVAGLIIFSVVWCIIRCACCAKSCCCQCFSCLKCCGNCCGCCDPPRGNGKQYLEEPYIPPNQGYKSQEPMHNGFGASASHHGQSHGVTHGGGGFSAAKTADFPQYAEFDVGKRKSYGNEDALPAMPSWEGAESKKIEVEEEEVELKQLKKPEAQSQPQSPTMMNGAAVMNGGPQRTTPSPGPRSPYGPPGSNGYAPPNAMGGNPYSQTAQSYNQPGGYGVAASAVGSGPRSPYDDNGFNNVYNNTNAPYGPSRTNTQQSGYGGHDGYGQQPYDNYGSQGTQGYGGMDQHFAPQEMDGGGYGHSQGMVKSPGGYGGYGQESRHTPGPQTDYSAGGYGAAPVRSPTADYSSPYGADARRSPAPQNDYSSPYGADSRRSPAPQGGDYFGQQRTQSPAPDYGSSYNSRPIVTAQYSSESTQPLRGPQRQYSSNAVTPADSGFDFSSGYSRPPPGPNIGGGGYR